MADTDALFKHFSRLKKPQHVTLSGLVLNEKGLERGLACGVEMFCMGVSASETHSQKNTGMTPAEAQARIIPMAKQALAAGKKVQASVQSAFGCGFEGPIAKEKVLGIVKAYLDAGIRNISLADTAGHAQPLQVEDLVRCHPPTGSGRWNWPAISTTPTGWGWRTVTRRLKSGVTYFESAFGGLGGCPFTKLPAGNVSTEDLVHSLQRMGLRKDIKLDVLLDVARQVSAFFDRELPGFILKSGSIVDFRESRYMREDSMKLLEGIRVLDMTNVLSGPFATLHLSLLGAEVIKIENPDGGDLARKLGNVPKYNKELMGTSFLAQNANKKSLTLNLKTEEGKEIFRKLVKKADVLVENFRPAVMSRLGFSYEELCKINPRLIYCAISGFGQTGPDALKPAYDQIIQGLSGVMAVNGDERLNPLRCRFPGLRHGRRDERGVCHHGGAVLSRAHRRRSVH